jgi:hypothetical protein
MAEPAEVTRLVNVREFSRQLAASLQRLHAAEKEHGGLEFQKVPETEQHRQSALELQRRFLDRGAFYGPDDSKRAPTLDLSVLQPPPTVKVPVVNFTVDIDGLLCCSVNRGVSLKVLQMQSMDTLRVSAISFRIHCCRAYDAKRPVMCGSSVRFGRQHKRISCRAARPPSRCSLRVINHPQAYTLSSGYNVKFACIDGATLG